MTAMPKTTPTTMPATCPECGSDLRAPSSLFLTFEYASAYGAHAASGAVCAYAEETDNDGDDPGHLDEIGCATCQHLFLSVYGGIQEVSIGCYDIEWTDGPQTLARRALFDHMSIAQHHATEADCWDEHDMDILRGLVREYAGTMGRSVG